LVLALSRISFGYSVLAHEALIDAVWEANLKPLLLKRFPGASAEQLREAHAHMYGGAIIQDLGYYPFGNKFFSDLAHYVRSGDFVEVLLAEAQDLNEYAFALGTLQHYAADSTGHPIGTNRSVPLLFPKLFQKFGAVVTYEEGPSAHLRTEFAFDVAQVAKAYHVFYQKTGAGPDYSVDHSTMIYVMDPKGRFRKLIPYGVTPDEVRRQLEDARRG